MTILRNRLSASVVGTALAAGTVLGIGAVAVGPASSAQAADTWVGTFSTKAECEQAKKAYISSFTKIKQGCTYFAEEPYFSADGYYFQYSTVA